MAGVVPCRLSPRGLYWSDLHYPLLDQVPNNIADIAAKLCVFNGGKEAIIVTEQDDVYVIGNNINNCLIPGYKVINPRVVMKNEELCGKHICQIVASNVGYCVAANTREGLVYTWGTNGDPTLGRDGDGAKPGLVDFGEGVNIIQLACGDHHILALDGNGQIYIWGLGSSYQLGNGGTAHQTRPLKLLPDVKVSSVTCGQYSSAVITYEGEVWVWGYNASGFIGNGTQTNVLTPYKVTSLKDNKIVQVVMSACHMLCLTDDGRIYICGTNNNCQLGDGTTNNTATFKLLEETKIFAEIAVTPGGTISAGQLTNGKVCVWGACWGTCLAKPTVTSITCIHKALLSAATDFTLQSNVHLERAGSLRDHSLNTIFMDEKSADTVFAIQGKLIYAHRSILQMRCQHFRKTLQNKGGDTKQVKITVDDYSYEVYRAFIEYLYTEAITIRPHSAVRLLTLAHKHHETHLKQLCVQLVESEMNEENAAAVYAAAVQCDAKNLQEFSARFTAEHMTAVSESAAFTDLAKEHMVSLLARCRDLKAFKT